MLLYLFDIVLPFCICVAFAFLLNTFFHEMGHAIPALLFKRETVTVYIGSYGDKKQSLQIKAGRLIIFCKYNPLSWFKGCCYHPHLSVDRTIAVIAMGPIASYLTTVAAWLLLFRSGITGGITFFIGIFFIISLLMSISTFSMVVRTNLDAQGRPLISDIVCLIELFRVRRLPAEFWQALRLIEVNKYEDAWSLLDKIIQRGVIQVDLYRNGVWICLITGRNDRARELQKVIKRKYSLNQDDQINEAFFLYSDGDYEAAKRIYARIAASRNDPQLYISMGACAGIMGDYDNSILSFTRAIELAPESEIAYANRGLSRILSGVPEEGLSDVKECLRLDPNNGFAFKVWSIYWLEKDNVDEAIFQLKKVNAPNTQTDWVDQFIENLMRKKLQNPLWVITDIISKH